MGEATYYILARCETPTQAEVLLTKFRDLNDEGVRAYNWWQSHRGEPNDKFWPVFRATFPLVSDYLDHDTPNVTEPSNGLAGLLDFIDEEDGQLYAEETDLCGNGTVWHCADWGPLTHWLVRHGAVQSVWLSDEDGVDYFDILKRGL